VLTVCARGVRAAKAAALLEKNGYKTQGVFGMKSWEENKYPVVYPKPAATSQK
jgi:rhodanese-related sulfurtransferase